jgi:hypothetical protein
MTGTLGFIIGALTIGSFAVTARHAYKTVDPTKLRLFVTAFLLFALAMVIWSLATTRPDYYDIQPILFASDVLLVIGTACMAFILLDGIRIVTAVLVSLIGALLLATRMGAYPPIGYVHDGLLYFNLVGGVRTVTVLAFGLIWLPAMLSVAGSLSRDRIFSGLGRALSSCFMALVLATAFFLSARRPSMIIIQFAFIAFLFLAMTVVNVLLINLHKELAKESAQGEAKHAARKQRSE